MAAVKAPKSRPEAQKGKPVRVSPETHRKLRELAGNVKLGTVVEVAVKHFADSLDRPKQLAMLHPPSKPGP